MKDHPLAYWLPQGAVALLGLLCLFLAAGTGAETLGLAGFGLAMALVFLALKAWFDAAEQGTSPPRLPLAGVTRTPALIALLAVLPALALGGLFLAASRAPGTPGYSIGLTLFAMAIGLLLYNLKSYYDHRETDG